MRRVSLLVPVLLANLVFVPCGASGVVAAWSEGRSDGVIAGYLSVTVAGLCSECIII